MGGNLTHLLSKVIVLHLRKGIELLFVVDCENRETTSIFQMDHGFGGRHDEEPRCWVDSIGATDDTIRTCLIWLYRLKKGKKK